MTTRIIELLTRENYESWRVQAEALLIKNDAFGYVDGSKQKPNEEKAAQTWIVGDSKARADLILSISPGELRHVRGCKTSREVWLKLESIYASKGPAKKATLLKRLTMMRFTEPGDFYEHVSIFFDIKDKLSAMEVEIHDDLFSIMLLYSLPKEFDNFRCAIESRDEIPNPETLKIKIIEEYSSRHNSEENAMTVKENTRRKKFNNKQRGTFKFKCFKCHQVGHKASECTEKKEIDSAKCIVESDVVSKVSFDTSFDSFNCVADQCNTVHNGSKNWILDSGCTSHLCKDVNKFVEGLLPSSSQLNLASNLTTKVEGKGMVTLSACKGESNTNVQLPDTLYVPDLRCNLISVARITDKGYTVMFTKDKAIVKNCHEEIVVVADRMSNLYYVRERNESASIVSDDNVWLWHERMGHLNARDLSKVLTKAGIKTPRINERELHDCDVCARGKMSALPFSKSNGPCNEVLRIVYSDVVGPINTQAIGGAKYFVTFIDDSTRWCEVYLLKEKSSVFTVFKIYKNYVENITGKRIKYFQTDNGGEYCNREFDEYLNKEGIGRRLTTPRTPQQNGVAERMNRTLVEMARCMLISSGLSAGFWADAVVTACHVRNRCPSSSLGGDIPYEKWYGRSVNLHYLQKFGTRAHVLDKEPNKSKFAERSHEGVFVGYPRDVKGYRVWIPSDKKIVITRDVRFHQNKNGLEDNRKDDPLMIEKCAIPLKIQPTYAEIEIHSTENPDRNSYEVRPDGEHSCIDSCIESTMPLTLDVESNCQGDMGPDARHEEPEKIYKRAPGRPRLDKSGTGRPKKIYQMVEIAPQRDAVPHHPCENESVSSDPDEFTDCNDFAGAIEITLKQALSSNEKYGWEQAILSEVKSLLKNGTWDIVKKPANRAVVGCRYVLTTKLNPDKTEKKKARLVAQGFSQRYGIDYHSTFAPVARLESVRLLVALAAEMDMEIHQLDINTAYLNGLLEEEIYMKVPQLLKVCLLNISGNESECMTVRGKAEEMLKDLESGGDVCRLKKALYGLKQAGRQWNIMLDQKLIKMKFKASINEPCLYFKEENGTKLFVLIYVDDILIACSKKSLIDDFKKKISKEFELKDFGQAKYILGIDIVRNQDDITLSQSKYIWNILSNFGMENCNSVSIPMCPNEKLIYTKCERDMPAVKMQDRYRALIGSLMYLATGTRPDIMHCVVKLAQFNENPNEMCWNFAKRVLRYLKRTHDHGLSFKKTGESIIGYSDSDWGSCELDRRSYSGYAFILGGASVSWKSQKQKCISTSSSEAEYVSLSQCMKEAVYLNSLLTEIGLLRYARITLYADNQGAISLAKDPVLHSRCKHIDIRYHFIRDVLKNNKDISLKYISTNDMTADILTKALPRCKLYKCMVGLGLRDKCTT